MQLKSFILLALAIFYFSVSCMAQEMTVSINTVATQYICIGDSITNGHDNTSLDAYPHQLALRLDANSYKHPETYVLPSGWLIQNGSNTTIINHGIESQKIQMMLENVETQVGNRLGGANETIVILLGGINDARLGRTATEIESDWVAYGAWCADHNVKLYIGTMTAANTHPFDQIRVEANAWLRANWQTFADKLIDFERNEALADSTDLTNFHTDRVHPNAVGDYRMGEVVYSIINGSYQIPHILRTSLSVGGLRSAYDLTLLFTGGDGAITWSHRSGALPSGIVFNAAAHKFEGVANAVGTYPNIVIRATDATGDFDEKIYTLTILRKASLCMRGLTRNCGGIFQPDNRPENPIRIQ